MNTIKETFQKSFERLLDIKFLEENIETWKQIEEQSVYLPTEYSYNAVLYQNMYFSERLPDYIDGSIILYHGGIPIGIWPICFYKSDNQENICIGSEGVQLLPPFILESYGNTETKRKLLEKCFQAITKFCLIYFIKEINCQTIIMENGLELWTRKLLEHGAFINGVRAESFLNLSLSEDEILNRIRRTNKYSILKGKKLWRIEIITKENSSLEVNNKFESFRQLHKEVAGCETRSINTWKIQCESVKTTNDFLVMLYDKDQLIGASLFMTTVNSASYAVAAYKRELFHQPVSHVSQWYAIKHMKQLGLKWYYIGSRFYENDMQSATEKERNISLFKEGFSTHIFSKFFLSINLSKLNYIEENKK